MTDKKEVTSSFVEALTGPPESRQEHLAKASNELRLQMEALALEISNLVLSQPPVELLGYLSAQLHMGILADVREQGENYRPNKDLIKKFQLAMEYAHAVWASNSDLPRNGSQFDEQKVSELFDKLDELDLAMMTYCMASTAGTEPQSAASTEFHAKSSWVLMRGHRYQVLEGEFFRYVLAPHDAALKTAYGMSADQIANEIQALCDSMRMGMSQAIQKMDEAIEKVGKAAFKIEEGADWDGIVEGLASEDAAMKDEVSGAIRDLFYGGTSNLSRHTKLPATLLDDISYQPGGNTSFFADGEFKGTPMRTLPARIRPAIKLDGEYYAVDAQFIRDSSYRSIQRGLIARIPEYKVGWDNGQKAVTENAYPAIFASQFKGASKWSEVFYKDATTGKWAETDLVLQSGDALLVIEAKAGVMAMHSPATDFEKHERTIKRLIVDAFAQCERFIKYLYSAPEVVLFNLVGGEYVEVARLRRNDFRLVLPIGLTVEAFTPFSAMCKEMPEIFPIEGKHPFISMSVDDLFVLSRFLPSTGELLHYLDVRQQVSGIPNVLIYDEIEHLGAYIRDNRFDMTIRDQLKEADMVTWDSFGDVVDEYFEYDNWKNGAPPHQEYPDNLTAILQALDRYRPAGWLDADSHIRNMSGKARTDLSEFIGKLLPTLADHPVRRLLFGGDEPIQMWVCRKGHRPTDDEIAFQAGVGCLATDVKFVRVLRISYENGAITGLEYMKSSAPSVLQVNYAQLMKEAESQRGRFVSFNGSDGTGQPRKRKK